MSSLTQRVRARVSAVTSAALAVLVLSSCSSPASITSAAATSPSPSTASYASSSFVIPFDVGPPAWLDPEPTTEQSNFVTWEAPNAPAVRFLAPRSVYRPGQQKDSAVPQEYLAYLLGLTSVGAEFRDRITTTIAGRPATRLTATIDHGLDGALGCPVKGMLAAACYGLQPGLEVRLAVIQVEDRTLLVWLRTEASMEHDELARVIESFDALLASLRFGNRPVQSEEPNPQTPVDGTYRMMVSWPKVKSADARCIGGAEGISDSVVYDLTLESGSMTLWVRVGGPSATRELGTTESYRILNDHQLSFGRVDSLDFRLTGESLTFSAMKGAECGDRAIFTTKPWLRT